MADGDYRIHRSKSSSSSRLVLRRILKSNGFDTVSRRIQGAHESMLIAYYVFSKLKVPLKMFSSQFAGGYCWCSSYFMELLRHWIHRALYGSTTEQSSRLYGRIDPNICKQISRRRESLVDYSRSYRRECTFLPH